MTKIYSYKVTYMDTNSINNFLTDILDLKKKQLIIRKRFENKNLFSLVKFLYS